MVKLNPLYIVRRLAEYYEETFLTDSLERPLISALESTLADHLAGVLDGILDGGEASVDEDCENELLDELRELSMAEFLDQLLDEGDEPDMSHQSLLSQGSSYQPSQPEREYDLIPFERKKAIVNYWNGKRKFSHMQSQFSEVKHRATLYEWEQQVLNGGSRNDKLFAMSQNVFEIFKGCRKDRLPVHDLDIRRWAIKSSRVIELDDFRASPKWLYSFKRMNRTVSRKITKFVTLKAIREEFSIREVAGQFVKSAVEYVAAYGPDVVFNTDQSGFNRELHSGRTLNEKGAKKVESLMQSGSAMTHSYTIQPTVSASGLLLPKILVVIQETAGSFGPIVTKGLFHATNLVVRASKSGKLDKRILSDYYKSAFFTDVNLGKSVLLVDAWSANSDRTIVHEATPDGKELVVLNIPPGTTGYIQPLDVGGF